MTFRVAIASENDTLDGEVYRLLLELLLLRPVEKWVGSSFTFRGCKSVAKLCPTFLAAAGTAGVRHAILAIDNDGGAKNRHEHHLETHSPPASFDIDDDENCRGCWLRHAVPSTWLEGQATCIVVPVQTIETWLLSVRGDNFRLTPEKVYDRPALKKRFYGRPVPSVATCLALAKDQLSKPSAIEVLRARPSFQRFEERVAGWSAA